MLRYLTIQQENIMSLQARGNAMRTDAGLDPVFLDVIDAAILSQIYFRMCSPSTHRRIDIDKDYYWIQTKGIHDDLPMLGIGIDAIGRRITKLLSQGFYFLERRVYLNSQTHYARGKWHDALLYSERVEDYSEDVHGRQDRTHSGEVGRQDRTHSGEVGRQDRTHSGEVGRQDRGGRQRPTNKNFSLGERDLIHGENYTHLDHLGLTEISKADHDYLEHKPIDFEKIMFKEIA